MVSGAERRTQEKNEEKEKGLLSTEVWGRETESEGYKNCFSVVRKRMNGPDSNTFHQRNPLGKNLSKTKKSQCNRRYYD